MIQKFIDNQSSNESPEETDLRARSTSKSQVSDSKSRIDGSKENESISVVIPAYNEGNRIQASVKEVIEYLDGIFSEFEILVIDDGSSDKTAQFVEEIEDSRVRCIVNEQNSGKGFSVRRGILEAKNEIILFSDADLSTPIDETLPLLRAIQEGADMAIASRWLQKDQEVERGPLRKLQGHVFAMMVRLTTLQGFKDTQCGFKMFKREIGHAIFEKQQIDRWGFDVEILFIAQKWNFTVKEVPVRWFQSDETKLTFMTPLTMLWDIIRVQWNNVTGKYDREEVPVNK